MLAIEWLLLLLMDKHQWKFKNIQATLCYERCCLLDEKYISYLFMEKLGWDEEANCFYVVIVY